MENVEIQEDHQTTELPDHTIHMENEIEEDQTTELPDHAVNYRGIKAMPFIIGNETFEKIGSMGTVANLSIYLTTVFHMKSITAATIINIFHGTSNLVPLLGAFLSDTYFGRYKTLVFASIASFLGMAVLALTAAIHKLHPPKCPSSNSGTTCVEPVTGQLAFLYFAFGLLVIGAGGIKPCNLAFGVDQFDPRTESGQKGINSFFNYYYFTFTLGVMVSVTLIVYIQSTLGWAIELGIPAVLMLFSCILFFMGSRLYVKVKPQGSPLTIVAQVVLAAARKRIFVSLIAMLVSGLVEGHRRHLALTRPTVGFSAKGGGISSMSAFCLVPQLVLTGIAEGLSCIALNEFYYKQFPENMRSIAGSFFFLGLAGASYLSGFLVSIVHRLTSTTNAAGDWLPDDLNKGYSEDASNPSSSEPSRVLTFHSTPRWQLHLNSVKETPKLMVIDFSASWCGPCKFMEPALHDMAERFSEVEFVKIDVDELPDVAQEFGVQAMPTFVLLKRGKEVDRVVGAQKNELEKKVDKHKTLPAAT
ncbi:Proton-dependent oligopeptide transporter family [Corchorus capsularis]|uniref:Proton-dependent oligopeptide transporter family n=1 Tax=Corchorus capsularis TaxID=210143 RepID=A0A1R3I987_COCAP|nr:Proton-dependent oligopeptide transporter family [Corchorus capsularis]